MQFGVFADLQLPRPWIEGAEQTLFMDAIDQVKLADQLGIGFVWAQEHHFLEEYSHSSAPEVFLAALSQVTSKIRLGHGVALMLPQYNHPARVAERISALDILSGGRVEWGTGESSSHTELGGFEIKYVEKRAMWAEATREAAKMIASLPYAGYQGKFFSMPARNVVPKPLQKPHPPMWVACSNRDTLKLAAKLGLGALTFAFMDASEAKFWVEEYYEIFRTECMPIGRTVNPNIAMLSGFMCDENGDAARKKGLEGLRFFAHGLSHYYRTGIHVPAETSLWEQFNQDSPSSVAGSGGFGTPDEIEEAFASFEEVGVDQLILLQQCGKYTQRDIMASLELFGQKVLPKFIERATKREKAKKEELQPFVDLALSRIPKLEKEEAAEPIEAYPLIVKRDAPAIEGVGLSRSLDAAALWRMHAGQSVKGGTET